MRVISGRLGRREFKSPKSYLTHPMSEKIRGALFNSLGDVSGLTVLDSFAGSGALAIEAISRGARAAVAVENDKDAAITIADNLRQLDLTSEIRLEQMPIDRWARQHHGEQFDLIFCDPPYDQLPRKSLELLSNNLKSDGILVLSWPGKADLPPFKQLQHISTKHYGEASVTYYKKMI